MPELVVGDAARLRQILVNIAGNAIKFTARGEVVVEVLLDPSTLEEVRLHFVVRDTGIGVATEKQATIFEAFSQADGSTTRQFGGTGLGLTISRQLAAAMHGRIWLESEPGRGSTFHFSVCLQPCVSAPPAEEPDLIGMPVLIVDRHPATRRELAGLVTKWGARAALASSLEEAAALAESEGRFEAALVSSRQFEDGRLARDAAGAVILLLTSTESSEAARSRQPGTVGHLTKPVRRRELRKLLAAARAGRRLPQTVTAADSSLHAAPQRILLAEDNPVNQRLAVKLLEREGHHVVVASNGKEAFELWQRQPFDLILMDLQMPVMDGVEASASIRRAERASGRHVPIIALTAHAMQGDRERCLDAGMDDYLPKPIRRSDLLESIVRHTERQVA